MTPLSPADFTAICALVCPDCAVGHAPVRRADNGEWVHNNSPRTAGPGVYSTGICWAHGLRASGYAPVSAEIGGVSG